MLNPEGHPVVAASLDLVMAGMAHTRPHVVGAARGRVLEVGAGTGKNFAHYGETVTDVSAIEPDPHMRRRAEARLGDARMPITLTAAGAEALPFPDATFDTAVLTWVICTIPEIERALLEVHRVLRPDGTLLFIEHVGSEQGLIRAAQGAVEPVWRRLAGGCHLTRDPIALLTAAGFEVTVERRYGAACSPMPMLSGRASRRG